MNIRSLLILTLTLVILAGTSSAANYRRREYRPKKAGISPARTFTSKVLHERSMAKAPRNGPIYPYSSRGYVIRSYRESKSIRGGGRGHIKVLP